MKLSLLILTYNRLPLTSMYIPKLIDMIGNVDNEVLIWDNGSSDGTYDWLIEYAKCISGVRVFGGDTNVGLEAINYLASEASGEYLLKVDDDIEVPQNFAQRMVDAYARVGNDKIAFLGWDMAWSTKSKSFALRSGKRLYKKPLGEMVDIGNGEKVLIHYTPSKWMVNGPCRLSPKQAFLDIGGHPPGVLYGVDHLVSIAAEKAGYYIAYLHGPDLVVHKGTNDSPEYRKMKDDQLRKFRCPKDV